MVRLKKVDYRMLAILALVILGLVVIPFVPAEFSIGEPNRSISKVYGPEMDIKGWVNMSIKDEPGDSVLEASFDGTNKSNISLEELLKVNPSYKFNCSPTDCNTSYSVTGPGTSSKSFTLGDGKSKLVGIRLDSSFREMESFYMDVQSDAGDSDKRQLIVDFLDDGSVEWGPTKSTGDFGSKETPEFEGSPTKVELTSSERCSEINLTHSPNVKIGGNVIDNDGGIANFKISIVDNEKNTKGACEVKGYEGPTDSVECIAKKTNNEDFSVTEEKEYSVCIKDTAEAEYGINRYTTEEGERLYDVFAKQGEFDEVGSFTLNNSEVNSYGTINSLNDYIDKYISDRYGNDCSGSGGCVVPIRFTSHENSQKIDLKNMVFKYYDDADRVDKTNIHDVETSAPLITSNPEFQRLFLDNAGLSVPSELGNYTFVLKLDGEPIVSEDIKVKNVPIIESLNPLTTAAGFETIFEVEVSVPENASVTNYNWDFGDERTDSVSSNKIVHIYSEIKNYTLELSVTDTRGLSSSGTFEIEVISPKDHINSTLEKMKSNLDRVKGDINAQNSFNQRVLKSVLRVENLSSEIEVLEGRFEEAKNGSEYLEMVGDLVDLNSRIPRSVRESEIADSFPFIYSEDIVEMSVVEAIGGGEYNSQREGDYQNAVNAWQHDNIDITVNFREFSAEYDPGVKRLANAFEFVVEEKKDINYDYYLIVPKQGIIFDRGAEEQGNYYYVNLRDNRRVSFYSTENVDFNTIPAFVSPSIDRLDLERTLPLPDDNSRTIILILSIVFLVVIGVTSYIVLQQWYKKKYEKYLFPNKNDLYNVINYVNSAKKRGLTKSEIRSKLKKSEWDSEQINYVMKKYEGRRTGMIELPLPKGFSKTGDEGPSKPPRGHRPHGKR
ncbi:MAG: PKD domain-containing protein [Candidatus Pacearchaeota archaeon]